MMTDISVLIMVPDWMGEWYYAGATAPEDTTADALQDYAYRLQALAAVQRTVINLSSIGVAVDLLTEDEAYAIDEEDDDALEN